MADFVRAYHPASNSDVTVTRGFAAAVGLRVLDKPAVDRFGKPLPAKPHRPVGGRRAATTPTDSPAPAGEGQADEATSTTNEATKEATE
jgi:hypothetical protein